MKIVSLYICIKIEAYFLTNISRNSNYLLPKWEALSDIPSLDPNKKNVK